MVDAIDAGQSPGAGKVHGSAAAAGSAIATHCGFLPVSGWVFSSPGKRNLQRFSFLAPLTPVFGILARKLLLNRFNASDGPVAGWGYRQLLPGHSRKKPVVAAAEGLQEAVVYPHY
jgi:hypothetical protein